MLKSRPIPLPTQLQSMPNPFGWVDLEVYKDKSQDLDYWATKKAQVRPTGLKIQPKSTHMEIRCMRYWNRHKEIPIRLFSNVLSSIIEIDLVFGPMSIHGWTHLVETVTIHRLSGTYHPSGSRLRS